MSKTIHRQFGKLGSRSADESNVSMIIKEVADTEIMLGKLLEHTRRWRDSWAGMLSIEVKLADEFHNTFATIPRTSDSLRQPDPPPAHVMERIEELRGVYTELRDDMMVEVDKVEGLLITPLCSLRDVIKPIKKAIERRENKKLDYERYNKQVESAKAKKTKSEREYSALSRAESSLEAAQRAYEVSDDYLKSYIPPILAKIVEFLPIVNEVTIQIQFTLLQHSYSSLHHYTADNGFSDTDAETIVEEWEAVFLPLQREIESDFKVIAYGKAVTFSMASLGVDSSLTAKLPGMGAKGKKPPPPPAPTSSLAPDRMGRQKSSTSLGSRYSSTRTESPPPPPPPLSSRPSIGARPSTSHYSPARDDSPPPPLPGPRPTTSNGAGRDDYKPAAYRAGSYSTGMGGSATPTPLAGLKPSQLKGGRAASFSDAQIENQSPRPSPARAAAPPAQNLTSIAAKKKPPPPPPKKKFLGPKEVFVRAIYDFQGQDHGDLSFSEGDKIKVTKKTTSSDDWWEGEVNGQKGSFPANYCEDY